MTLLSNLHAEAGKLTTIQSVSEITESIKLLLENSFSFVSVRGEVSNLRKPYSGHIYFILKDESCQLKAVLFKMQQRYLSKELSNGDTVVCRGHISLYGPRGEYQIIVDSVEFCGEGDLQLAFEQLKIKLDQEGLFAVEKKKHIPFFPRSIALITSPSSAAVHDFFKIAQSRFASLPIEIHPVRVQGAEAAEEICQAVLEANRRKTSDVIVICRGGGSIEDLWPFNDETLARCVFQSELPVVSAIGHEIDFTILDFVADLRAPTPSAAAEQVVPSQRALLDTVSRHREIMARCIARKINEHRYTLSLQERLLKDPTALLQNYRLQIDQLQSTLIYTLTSRCNRHRQALQNSILSLEANSPQQSINQTRPHISELQKAMHNSLQHTVQLHRSKITNAVSLLSAVNPSSVLQRGYSIVFSEPDHEIIYSSDQVEAGDNLRIQTSNGIIDSQVTKRS